MQKSISIFSVALLAATTQAAQSQISIQLKSDAEAEAWAEVLSKVMVHGHPEAIVNMNSSIGLDAPVTTQV